MKYDLAFFSYPAALIVANRAKQEAGDYQRLAAVSLFDGKVTWYNNPPENIRQQILESPSYKAVIKRIRIIQHNENQYKPFTFQGKKYRYITDFPFEMDSAARLIRRHKGNTKRRTVTLYREDTFQSYKKTLLFATKVIDELWLTAK